MKAAPEKINVLPVSAIILKELLKRFKLENIVISDAGVKEGYLALVLAGVEKGVAVDLKSPVPLYAPVDPPKSRKSGSSEKSEKSEKPKAKSENKKDGTAKKEKTEKEK